MSRTLLCEVKMNQTRFFFFYTPTGDNVYVAKDRLDGTSRSTDIRYDKRKELLKYHNTTIYDFREWKPIFRETIIEIYS